MSELAPFVTASMPQDAVVQGQQTQIQGLQDQVRTLETDVQDLERRLHERNPQRSVKIQSGNGEEGSGILIADEWNAEHASEQYSVDLFPDHADVHTTLGAFLKAQLIVDGQTAIRSLGEALTFTTTRFAFCGMIELEYLYVRAQLAQDFVIHLYIAPVTADEYCVATAAHPSTFVATGCIHTRDETERVVPLQQLQMLAHKPVKLSFDEGACKIRSDFLFDHLQVPYIP